MPIYLRQSTASQEVPLGHFLDSTDGNTEETALTIANTDIQVWKTGATSLANKNSGGATHMAGGVYYATLDATDTNTIGPLVLFVHVSGALAVKVECVVLDEAVYDVLFGTTAPSTYAGGDTSGVTTLLSRVGGALTISGGRVDSNVKYIDDAAISTHATGMVPADVRDIAGAAVSASTAQLGVNVVNWKGSAAAAMTGDAYARLGAPAGASVSADVAAVKAQTAAIEADTGTDGVVVAAASKTGYSLTATTGLGNQTANITGNLSGSVGSVTGAVGSVASGGITAASIATNAIDADAIATDAVTELQSGLATAANLATLTGYVDTEVAAILAAVDTEVAAIKTKTDYLPSATAGAAGGLFIAGSNAATTVNITGNVTGNLSGSVGSVTGAVGSVTGAVGSVTGNVGGNVAGSVASVTNAVTVGANNDKTGYSLSAAGVQAIWDALTSALTTVGSVGKRIADNLDGTVSSRSSHSAADVWAVATRTLTSAADSAGVTTLLSRIVGTLAAGTHNAQSGDAYARLGAPAGASVSADVAAVKAQTAAIEADTQDLQTQVGVDGAGLTALPWNAAWDAEVQSEAADALNAYDPPTNAEMEARTLPAADYTVVSDLPSVPSAASIADAVWDEAIAGHAGAGSTGAALAAAGTAGDPWSTALPGAYGAGTAGKLLADLPTAAEVVAAMDADPPAVNVTMQAGVAVAAADANGSVPVVLYPTQGAVTFNGQVKITTNVSGQGALDVRNSNANGHGVYADGGNFGLRTQGGNGGQGNYGTYYGQANSGATGVYNYGSTAAVEGVDPAGIRAALGMAAADLDDQLDGIGSGLSAQEVRDAMKLAPSAGDPAAGSVDAHLDDILTDTGTTLPAAIAGVGAGSGTGYYSDTVDNGTSPLDGVRVQLCTAADRVGLAYEAYTNALGVFEMWPDPGTYYRWLDLAGYSFTQDVEVEVTEP